MADLQPLLPRKISQSIFPSIDAPPAIPSLPGMGGGLAPLLPMPAQPSITSDPRIAANSTDPLFNRASADNATIYRINHPIAPTTTLGKIKHVAANIGNVLGNIFAPAETALVHGSDLNNQIQKSKAASDLDDVSQLQTAQAGRAQQAAQTALTEAQPGLQRAKVLSTLAGKVVPKGFKPPTFDDEGNLQLEEDPNSQAFQNQQALQALHQSQSDKDDALTAIATNKYQPGTPEYDREQTKIQLAEQTRQIAAKALGLRADTLGFNENKFYNPQPTAQERNKGDLGNSAIGQIQTMRQLVAAHPEFAGPGAGATQAFQRWLSSNGEDAGKFLAARQYLADHSAAVFGGRGEYISKQMEGLTNPNFSPSTLGGVLDQAEQTANTFTKAGQTHNKAGVLQPQQSANPVEPLPKEIEDAIQEGHQATLSDGSVWKKVNGKAQRVK